MRLEEGHLKEVYYGDFRVVVLEHIRRIEAAAPEAYSTGWFLLRYLRRIARLTAEPGAEHGVQSGMRSLLRFYVDQVEETSDLGDVCNQVFEAHRRSLRVQEPRG